MWAQQWLHHPWSSRKRDWRLCQLAAAAQKGLVVPGNPRVSPVPGDIVQKDQVLIKQNSQQMEPFSNIVKVSQEKLRMDSGAEKVTSLERNCQLALFKWVVDASPIFPNWVSTNQAKFWLVQKHVARCSVGISTQDVQFDKNTGTRLT